MFRTITEELVQWKNSKNRKPLILTGVRQCGKTYTVKKFAETDFESFVYINFEETSGAGSIFEFDYDVERIKRELEIITGQSIVSGKTLVFFDEIQECPRGITALKYFCENDPELHVICAGSLLGVALGSGNISFPVGKVNRLRMRPMSFREFAVASGKENLIKGLESWPVERPIPDLFAVPMKKLLKEYYIVGGMPEAVKVWLETRSFVEVDKVHREILRDYADDFSKHAPVKDIPKIRWIWDSIPVQLAKENNKFVFSHVKKGKRSAELEDALQWLVDAGLITQLYLAEKPEIPLSGSADRSYFKVYMSDIGLLRAKAGLPAETILEGSAHYMRFKGALAENYVLNEMEVLGYEPYFWRSGNTAEIDFILENQGNIIPVEVKAADNTQAKSFRLFCRKYNPKHGYKLSEKNIAENMSDNTKAVSLPLYLAWNIGHYSCT